MSSSLRILQVAQLTNWASGIILKLLREHDDLTVEDLANRLGITVPTVSRHLQLLRMQNLVTFQQDAQNRYYSVNEGEITRRIAAFLRDLDISLPNA